MAEGKTLVPSAPCDLCEGDDSVNFCTNCQEGLCLRCSTAHRKIPDLSHHKLRPITDRRTSGTTPPSPQAYCKDHPSKPLSVICEQCLKALCVTCADGEHRNHKLLRTNLNAEMLQRVCVQKVPEFLDLLQKLDKEKDGSPIKLQLYKQARNMVKISRDHLWKMIEDDSKELLEQIEKEIKTQEVLLVDISANLKDTVSTTEQLMSVLSNARKISNPDTLLTNIQDGDKIIENAKTLLNQIENTRKSYTIDDLLPCRKELILAEKNLHTFFTMTPITDGISTSDTKTMKKIIRNYNSMTKIGAHHIGKCKGVLFRISECSVLHSNSVFIYEVSADAGDTAIYEFNTRSNQKKKFKCSKEILRMATLSKDRHVIVEQQGRVVSLLDANFNIIISMKEVQSGFEYYGVFPTQADSIIVGQVESMLGPRTIFSDLIVSGTNILPPQKLCEVNSGNNLGLFSVHPDQKHITMSTTTQTLRTTDITTGQHTELNLSAYVGKSAEIKYICVDEQERILVGDSSGKVYITTSTKYESESRNMLCAGNVGGISIRGDKVVIVAGEYINIYQ